METTQKPKTERKTIKPRASAKKLDTGTVDRAARRAQVSELYLKGQTQAQIATQFGVSQVTISRDLAYIQNEWVKQSMALVTAQKAKELAKIDHLERTYWTQYAASLEPLRKVVRTAVPGQDNNSPATVSIVTTTTERLGSMSALNGVQWCIEQRCKIMGIASSKVEITWRETVTPEQANVVNSFFEEATRALAAKLIEEDDTDEISL